MTPNSPIAVGLCGAGLGGLAAAIAIARAGCDVTVLEAAAELGEARSSCALIGAGIQMTPNVSRLLIKWGVADIIGDDLVQCKEINMRRTDGKIVQRTELVPKTAKEFGFPWWVVHRHHLHFGLAEAARRHGVQIVTNARVAGIDHHKSPVQVKTAGGKYYEFDLLIGSDGIKSVVRQTLFPDVKPRAVTNNAAYRAVMPYKELYNRVPEAREFGNAIDIWMQEKGYVIMYPIAAGRDWNAVLSHHRDQPVTQVEEDVDMAEVRAFYKDVDPRLKKIIDVIPSTKRWPLLITGPLPSWSSPQKNVVLMGDAAHSMVNHLAQGAATSMEDGAFLGRVLAEVVRGGLSLGEAIHVYEKTRMPRAWIKQQASFVNGAVSMFDPTRAERRDAASADSVAYTSAEAEVANLQTGSRRVTGPDANAHSWNLWGAPETVQSIFGYDPEGDADHAILAYLAEKTPWDRETGVSEGIERKWTGWFLEEADVGRVAKSRGSKL